MRLNLKEIIQVIDGSYVNIDPDFVFEGSIQFDSRKVKPGDIYLAWPGDKLHGLDFAKDAINKGAVAVISTKEYDQLPVIIVPKDLKQINIKSSVFETNDKETSIERINLVSSISKIANYIHNNYRKSGLKTVAITGSAGKTTTKDFIVQILEKHFDKSEILFAAGSANNELSVPQLATELNGNHKIMVIEMGARHKGDIEYLTKIIKPNIAVVTNVGNAHIGEFGSAQIIAETKGELPLSLDFDDIAILNLNDPIVNKMPTKAKRKIFYGIGNPIDSEGHSVTIVDQELLSDNKTKLTLRYDSKTASFETKLMGDHILIGICASIATAISVGIDFEKALKSAENITMLSGHRMDTWVSSCGVTVIDDTYNANPESMKAAIKTLVSLKRNPENKTWAILGEMAELGDASINEHDKLGRNCVRLNIDKIVCVGESRNIRSMYQGAIMEGSWNEEAVHIKDLNATRQYLRDNVVPGDIVLIKASNSFKFWELTDIFERGS